MHYFTYKQKEIHKTHIGVKAYTYKHKEKEFKTNKAKVEPFFNELFKQEGVLGAGGKCTGGAMEEMELVVLLFSF